jgi:phosphoribosyl-ATP pyrophosphohydrolase
MNPEQVLKKLAQNLDDKIKLKGILEMVDGIIIEKLLIEGHKALSKKHPEIAGELIELAEAYLTADANGMVDEAADLLAAIVKKIFLAK